MGLLESVARIVELGGAPARAERVAALRASWEERTGAFSPEDPWFEERSRGFWDDAVTTQRFGCDVADELREDERVWLGPLERAHRGLFRVSAEDRDVLEDVWSGAELVVLTLVDDASRAELDAARRSAPLDGRTWAERSRIPAHGGASPRRRLAARGRVPFARRDRARGAGPGGRARPRHVDRRHAGRASPHAARPALAVARETGVRVSRRGPVAARNRSSARTGAAFGESAYIVRESHACSAGLRCAPRGRPCALAQRARARVRTARRAPHDVRARAVAQHDDPAAAEAGRAAAQAVVLDRLGARRIAPFRDRGDARARRPGVDVAARDRRRRRAPLRRPPRLLHACRGRRCAGAHGRDGHRSHPRPQHGAGGLGGRVARSAVDPARRAARGGPALPRRARGARARASSRALRGVPLAAARRLARSPRLRADPRARIQGASLSALGLGHAAPHAWICGLERMVGSVREILRKDMGIARQQVHSERYD